MNCTERVRYNVSDEMKLARSSLGVPVAQGAPSRWCWYTRNRWVIKPQLWGVWLIKTTAEGYGGHAEGRLQCRERPRARREGMQPSPSAGKKKPDGGGGRVRGCELPKQSKRQKF